MLSHFALYAAALILFSQALAGNPTKANDKLPPPCTVSGRVVTAAEGSPLKSARVLLMPDQRGEGWEQPQVYSALSESDGKFTIKNVPAGRYRFSAKHTGYVDQPYQSSGAETGAVLALQAGQEIKDVIFRMILAAVITGKVSDEDGEPMAGIQVVALHRPTEDELEEHPWHQNHQELSPVAGSQTDDRGQYRLYGLKPGEYYIRAVDHFEPSTINAQSEDEWQLREALGSEFAPVYYPGVTQMSQAQAVPVAAGEEAQIDFAMARTKTIEISGRVMGVDGKPTTDAYLLLEEMPATEYGMPHTATPNDKGEFTIRGVPPGSYVLIAQQRSSGSDESGYSARQKIEVAADKNDSVTLVLGRGIRVSGRVSAIGGNLHPERLFAELMSQEDDFPGGWARIKKDGSFEMLDVPEGSFTLNVNGLERGWYVKSARMGAENVLKDGLQIEKGQGAGTLQVLVSNTSAGLEGSVKQDGKPLVGARVRLNPDPETAHNRERMRSTSTDQAGHFSLNGIAPGQYKIVAKLTTPEGAKLATSDAQAITLSEHDHKTIELTIAAPQAQ